MITLILAALAIALLLRIALASMLRPRNFPPGPLGLPFFGSVHLLLPDGIKRAQMFFDRYGDIFSLKERHINLVCIRGYELIKEVMVTNPKPYSDRFDMLAERLIRGPNLEGIILALYGAKWSAHRKLFQSAVRKMRFGSVNNIIEEELPYLVEEMQKLFKEGQVVDPAEVYEFAVLNILAYMVFGNRYSYGDPKFKTLMKLNNDFFKLEANLSSISFLLVSSIPYLHKIWLPRGVRDMVACGKEIEEFVRTEVEYHKSTLDPQQPRDFIDYYLVEMAKQTSNHFTEFGLVMAVADVFQAGLETTLTTLKWATLYMVNNPDIQEKVQREIESVLGSDKLPTYEDKHKMPFTEATIMEVQRRSNLAPFGVVHVTNEDVRLNGFELPKGTGILPMFKSIHHSPAHWKNPNKFDPENFLDSDGQVGARPAFMPFGGGLRICLGMNIAKQQLFLYFVTTMQIFSLLPPPGLLKLDENYVFSMTLQPKPYKVVMKNRF